MWGLLEVGLAERFVCVSSIGRPILRGALLACLLIQPMGCDHDAGECDGEDGCEPAVEDAIELLGVDVVVGVLGSHER